MTLPVELCLQLFFLCDLEGCLALSETSKTFSEVFVGLDQTLIRSKVQQRVPWIRLDEKDTEIDSWARAARLVRARTSGARSNSPNWKIVKNLRPLLSVPPVIECVSAVNVDTNLPDSFEPIFDEINLRYESYRFKGDHLCVDDMSMSLKTLRKSVLQPSKPRKPKQLSDIFDDRPEHSNMVIHEDDPVGQRLLFSGENATTIHLTEQRKGLMYSQIDYLVHKPGSALEDGTIGFDPSSSVALPLIRYDGANGHYRIKMLPAPFGGVFIVEYSTPTLRISYMDSDPYDNKVVLLAKLEGHTITSFPVDIQIEIYNGLLFFNVDGQFVRLWVDLGFQKRQTYQQFTKLNASTEIRGFYQQRKYTRALSATRTDWAPIGLYTETTGHADLEPRGKERYITAANSEPFFVGDLLTGKTYVAEYGDGMPVVHVAGVSADSSTPVFYEWARDDFDGLCEDLIASSDTPPAPSREDPCTTISVHDFWSRMLHMNVDVAQVVMTLRRADNVTVGYVGLQGQSLGEGGTKLISISWKGGAFGRVEWFKPVEGIDEELEQEAEEERAGYKYYVHVP
ncbi:hypothetical protein CJU89_3849 [Yarrowia sp. B02]|nr:hypothetical protein CJU89_3849 [Yarrowia sp. B02]